jgi:hypothetical protein
MPLLNPSWTINGRQPFLETQATELGFTSALPSAEALRTLDLLNLTSLSLPNITSSAWENFSKLSTRAIYRMAATTGIVSPKLNAVSQFYNRVTALNVDPISVVQAIQSGDPYNIIVTALDASLGVLSAIPVVGWAFAIARDVATIIENAIEMLKQDPKQAQPAIEYDKDVDSWFCAGMLDTAATKDWTSIFMPMTQPSHPLRPPPSDVKVQRVKFQHSDAEGDLIQFTRHAEDWLGGPQSGIPRGCVPGVPRVDGWYEILDRGSCVSAKHKGLCKFINVDTPAPYGQGFAFEPSPVSAAGDYLPSVTQLGFQLWGAVRKNTPQAWAIDHNKILGAWQDYYYGLRDYILWLIADGGNRHMDRAAALSFESLCGIWTSLFIKEGQGGYAPGVSIVNTYNLSGFTKEQFERRCIQNDMLVPAWKPGRGGPRAGQYYGLFYGVIEFVIENAIKALMEEFGKSITVAYVDDSYPALNNVWVRNRWEESRARLLEHPARYSVELDMIPDAGYREKMQIAQKLGGPQLTAAPARPVILDGGQTVPVPTPKPPGAIEHGSSVPTVLGVGAILGLGAVAYTQRDRIGQFLQRWRSR